MRIQRTGVKKARIEIVPMIDTIFFLLVFFMIATLSMSEYRGLPVNLPRAASGQQPPTEAVSITLTKDGRVLINKQEVKREVFLDRLREYLANNLDLLVIINADHGVQHGEVVEIMDEARQAGVAKMAIAVKPKEKGP
ncbi:MAG: biopolymer transporter ExbD [Deltaproteobacteria bacterium]|nr:biopolymer transporter ExbD [Deltaproteobacteria bacterium]